VPDCAPPVPVSERQAFLAERRAQDIAHTQHKAAQAATAEAANKAAQQEAEVCNFCVCACVVCVCVRVCVCVLACVRECVRSSMLEDNHHEASFFATPPLQGLPPLPQRVLIC
jgi:hypothetical protein